MRTRKGAAGRMVGRTLEVGKQGLVAGAAERVGAAPAVR